MTILARWARGAARRAARRRGRGVRTGGQGPRGAWATAMPPVVALGDIAGGNVTAESVENPMADQGAEVDDLALLTQSFGE